MSRDYVRTFSLSGETDNETLMNVVTLAESEATTASASEIAVISVT